MMANPITSAAWGPIRLRANRLGVLAGLLCQLAFLGGAGAKVITSVPPGEGTLETAIGSAAPGDVLRLSAGGEYLLASGSTTFSRIDRPLTLEVEPGSVGNAVVRLSESPSTSTLYFFTVTDGGRSPCAALISMACTAATRLPTV